VALTDARSTSLKEPLSLRFDRPKPDSGSSLLIIIADQPPAIAVNRPTFGFLEDENLEHQAKITIGDIPPAGMILAIHRARDFSIRRKSQAKLPLAFPGAHIIARGKGGDLRRGQALSGIGCEGYAQ
jgi:hypothetical protein